MRTKSVDDPELDPPESGVQRVVSPAVARGRIGLLEPEGGRQLQWTKGLLGPRIDVFRTAQTLLGWSGRSTRTPQFDFIVLGMPDGLSDKRWAELALTIGNLRSAGLPILVDARRCDVERAIALGTVGAIVCASDLEDPHPIASALLHGGLESLVREAYADSHLRRLLKTLGASELARRHGLSARQYRVVRTLMDIDPKELPRTLGIERKTADSHLAVIRAATNLTTLGFIRAAFELTQDFAWRLRTVL